MKEGRPLPQDIKRGGQRQRGEVKGKTGKRDPFEVLKYPAFVTTCAHEG